MKLTVQIILRLIPQPECLTMLPLLCCCKLLSLWTPIGWSLG